jgi:hypothetical protein
MADVDSAQPTKKSQKIDSGSTCNTHKGPQGGVIGTGRRRQKSGWVGGWVGGGREGGKE